LDIGTLAGSNTFGVKPPSPAKQCYSREIREALQESLHKLPFEQRVAITLRDLEGLSYEEIGELTGANLGTVKSRIARGRDKLRTLLKPCWEGSRK
jgi:RNA polymerase sigma-70 factor (ECF subfamily)